jgi:CheY-like chemotaxis protein
MLLRLLGNEVATANDGVEALDTIGSYRPQVILCDIGMPGMSGFEVARRLREGQLIDESVTLIALTGYGTEEDRQRTAAAGFQGHLVKPVDLAKLETLLSDFPHGERRRPSRSPA